MRSLYTWPAVVAAKSQIALTLVALLQKHQRELDKYRVRIEALFASHPDHDLFGSLPGPALARVLWRMWQDHTSYDAERHLTTLKKHGSLPLPRSLVPRQPRCEYLL